MATITNKNSIATASGQTDLFLLSQAGTRFINRGNLTTTGTQSSTIDITADNVIVQNFGDLTASGANSPTLLAGHRDDPVDGVAIYNFGTILNNASFVDLNGNGVIDLEEYFPDGIQYHGTNGLIENRGTISVPTSDGAAIGILASDTTVVNSGEIHANSFGIIVDDFGGGRDRNTIVNDGLIDVRPGTFGVGIWVRSNDNRVINEGDIIAAGENYIGILLEGTGNYGENTGVVDVFGSNATGVYLNGTGHTFINRGTIDLQSEFGSPAVRISADEPAGTNTGTFVNYGTVMTAIGLSAIVGSDGNESIINRGAIIGGVYLEGGNDTFLIGKGSEGVLVDLGAGADLLIVEKGFGTIRETLAVFGFAAGAAGQDVIDVSGLGIGSFEELMSQARQDGLDVRFDFGGDSQLSLSEVTLASLTPDDFIFAQPKNAAFVALDMVENHSFAEPMADWSDLSLFLL